MVWESMPTAGSWGVLSILYQSAAGTLRVGEWSEGTEAEGAMLIRGNADTVREGWVVRWVLPGCGVSGRGVGVRQKRRAPNGARRGGPTVEREAHFAVGYAGTADTVKVGGELGGE